MRNDNDRIDLGSADDWNYQLPTSKRLKTHIHKHIGSLMSILSTHVVRSDFETFVCWLVVYNSEIRSLDKSRKVYKIRKL